MNAKAVNMVVNTYVWIIWDRTNATVDPDLNYLLIEKAALVSQYIYLLSFVETPRKFMLLVFPQSLTSIYS